MTTSPALQQILGGRFRIDAKLGEGGMGAVFVATDLSIRRQVAVKLLRPELADDPVSLERMREEASSLAALHHPNVVQLYDFHAGTAETTFLLMELVHGESLSRRLSTQGPLPVAVAVDYARQVLSALSAAHAKGIIHRDIKPGNVLVVSVPMQKDLIKVLDFGIAKLTEETIRRRPTTAGILIGTPAAMSPEQASGRPVDARSDIYAAGLLLYTLLAGGNPFSGSDDLAGTLVRVQSVVPMPISQVRPDVSSALSEIIAVAMAKNPAERFQTAEEFVNALDWATGAVSQAAPAPVTLLSPSSAGPTGRASQAPASGHPQAGVIANVTNSQWTGPASSGPEHTAQSAAPSYARVSMRPPDRSGLSAGAIVAIALGGLLVVAIGAIAYLVGRSDAPPPLATVADAAPPNAAADAAPTRSAPNSTASANASIRSKPQLPAPAATTSDRKANCDCALSRNSEHIGKHGGLPLGKKIVPLDCQCDSKLGGTLCPHEIRKCGPTDVDCEDGFTPCKDIRLAGRAEGEACTGWVRRRGDRTSGTLSSCKFPSSVTGYSGKKDEACTGFTVQLQQTQGLLRCD